MIDYEEVVEAIWRYDCPRINIDEDITTLYADGKAFAQVIHRADESHARTCILRITSFKKIS